MANGNTSLHNAIQQGFIDGIVQELTQNPHLINVKNNDGNTPLNLIFATDFYDPSINNVNIDDVKRIIRILVEAGANVNIPNNDDNTPLHRISVFDEFGAEGVEIAELLILEGADINNQALNNDFVTPLHLAVYSNYSDMIKYFVSVGADVNIKDRNGNTPLHAAIEEEKYLEFSLLPLINEQTDLTIKNNNNKTVIDLLAEKGKFNENGEFIYPEAIQSLLPSVIDKIYQRYERDLNIYFKKNQRIDVIRIMEQRNLLATKNIIHPSFLLKDNLSKLHLKENEDIRHSIDSKVINNASVNVKKIDEELFSTPIINELRFVGNQGQSNSFTFALATTSNDTNQETLNDYCQGTSSSSQSLTSPNNQQQAEDENSSDFDCDTLEEQTQQLGIGIEQGRVSTSSGINRLPSFNETFNRFGNWQTPQQTDYQHSGPIQHDPLSLFLSDEEKKSTGRDNALGAPSTSKGIDQQAWNDCLEGASPSQNYSQNDEPAPIQPVQQLSDTNVEHLQGPNMQS